MALRTIDDLTVLEFNDETVWIEIYPALVSSTLGSGLITVDWWTDFFQKIHDTGLVTGISIRNDEINRFGSRESAAFPTASDSHAVNRCVYSLSQFPFQKMWLRKLWLFANLSSVDGVDPPDPGTAMYDIEAEFGTLPLTNYFYNATWWKHIIDVTSNEAANWGFDEWSIDTEPYGAMSSMLETGPANEYNYGLDNHAIIDSGSGNFAFDEYPITEDPGTGNITYDKPTHQASLNTMVADLRTLTGETKPFPRSFSSSDDPSATHHATYLGRNLDEIRIGQKTFYYPLSPGNWFAHTRESNENVDVHACSVGVTQPLGTRSGSTANRHITMPECFESTYLQYQVPSESHLDSLGFDGNSLRNLRNITDPLTGWEGDDVIFADFKNDFLQLMVTGDLTFRDWDENNTDHLTQMNRVYWHRFWGKDDKLVDGQGYRGELLMYVDGSTRGATEMPGMVDELLAYSITLNNRFPPTGDSLRRIKISDRISLNTGKYRCVGSCAETHWEVQLLDRVYQNAVKTLSLKTTSTHIDDDVTSGSARDVDDGITIHFSDNRTTIIDIDTEGLFVQLRSRNRSIQTNRAGDEAWSSWSDWKDILMSSKNIYAGIG